MPYDPSIPKKWYEQFGEKEWSRLSRNRLGELLCAVHLDVLQAYIHTDDTVLELGAGAGFFSKEIVMLAGRTVVSDISERQLEINRVKMSELHLADRVSEFRVLDITDLRTLADNEFSVVVCVGGALNYTMDREQMAMREMTRVLRPGGTLILGVMSLFSALARAMSAVLAEKQQYGIEATRWLFKTGLQDGKHYPSPQQHYVHMMKATDLDALVQNVPLEVVERRGAGLFALSGEAVLDDVKKDSELWPLIVEQELRFSRDENLLNAGANIIYVMRKTA